MTRVSAAVLEGIYGPALAPSRAIEFERPLNDAMERWQIVTPERQVDFLAHVGHESSRLNALVENLYYSSVDRLVAVFRRFDLNRDGDTDADELEFAGSFVGQPTKLGNYIYAGRNGNGGTLSGDGYMYRGRGLIQTTGRDNYEAVGKFVRNDPAYYLARPDDMANPWDAAQSAAYFFASHGCNELADAGNFREQTRVINGSYNGWNDRCALRLLAKEILL